LRPVLSELETERASELVPAFWRRGDTDCRISVGHRTYKWVAVGNNAVAVRKATSGSTDVL
jgi:hypothetical protein